MPSDRSGSDLEYASLIKRAGFDPSDPAVYRMGIALLEQLADERDLEDVGNMTASELATYLTTETVPETIFADYLYNVWGTYIRPDPEDSGLLIVPTGGPIQVDDSDPGLLTFTY